MKLGFGLYQHMLNHEHYKFARQAGATHIVAHLTDYFYRGNDEANDQPVGNIKKGWGVAKPEKVWSPEFLASLKKEMAKHELTLEALENINPAFWHDVLLDGPKWEQHIENVKQLIRNMGQVEIPVLGYNFALAGVAGRIKEPSARGKALAVGLGGPSEALNEPIPLGMVWNMIYDQEAPEGVLESISREELLRRYRNFLDEVLPVAEDAGVKLAVHPDDPPMEVRRQPRLGYKPEDYIEIIDMYESSNHVMEFCLGTMAEMAEGDMYETVEYFAAHNRVGYIHFRNVSGKVPYYKETFVDNGDIDMRNIIKILKDKDYRGVIIPDHAPQMSCDAPWHAGMAYAMGYIKALIQAI